MISTEVRHRVSFIHTSEYGEWPEGYVMLDGQKPGIYEISPVRLRRILPPNIVELGNDFYVSLTDLETGQVIKSLEVYATDNKVMQNAS